MVKEIRDFTDKDGKLTRTDLINAAGKLKTIHHNKPSLFYSYEIWKLWIENKVVDFTLEDLEEVRYGGLIGSYNGVNCFVQSDMDIELG